MKDSCEITLKLPEEILKKTAYIAAAEGRTLNNQFLLMLRNNIAYFERTKGKIGEDKLTALEVDENKKI